MNVYAGDKAKVLNWLEKHAWGYKNALTRKDILPFIGMPDRRFRLAASALIKDNQVASSSSYGYFFIPLCCGDPETIAAVKHCRAERNSRAVSMFKSNTRQEREDDARCQGQMVLEDYYG